MGLNLKKEVTVIKTPTIISNNPVFEQICTHTHLNPLNAELNPICHLLALLGAHRVLHVSRIRVNNEFTV